jgi:acylphosphatase
MKTALSITVSGRVQGVGFRFSAVRKAEELNIKGFVQNKSNGTVYIEVEGESADLNKFVEWCHEGPGTGLVDHVVTSELPVQNFGRFGIR